MFFYAIQAQDNHISEENLREYALKVFIDCNFCDIDYIRQEISFINYMRDSKDAQVHILGTSQSTGSGGREYVFTLIGQKDFKGMNDTIKYASGPNDTREEIRSGRIQVLKLSLMRYVVKTPLYRQIRIDSESPSKPLIVEDKWKNWVFEIDMSNDFSGEKSMQSTEIETSIKAVKITPKWKIELDEEYDYNRDKFVTEEDTTIISIKRSWSLEHLIVKSLGAHWSVGANFDVNSSSYRNFKFKYLFYPAIEYNIFPYSQSTRKQLRFLYSIGYSYNKYNDTTLYMKMEDKLFGHKLEIAYEVKEKWGSISSSLRGSNYFNDFSWNSLNFWSSISLRIIKGLSFRISGHISLIHDQISLPKKGATPEEILLRQRQLASQYKYSFEFGISYTFGAIYNNIVNPRFGD